MTQTKLQNRMKKEQDNKGALLMRPKDSSVTVFSNPERDIAYAWPYIHSEATALLQARYHLLVSEGEIEEKEALDKLLILDRITKFYIKFHSDALTCRSAAFGNIAELYASFESEDDRSVYAEYTAAITNAIPYMLFGSQTFGLGAEEAIDQTRLDTYALHHVLGSLSSGLRKQVARELADQGHISNRADISHLLMAVDSYIPGIREEEDKQRAKYEASKK